MDRPTAAKMIKDTFESPFDKGQFINLSKNLFKHLDVSGNFLWAGNRLPNAGAFQPHINSIERIGKSDVQSKPEDQVDVLIVNLKKETSLERARTIQRNFVARYLEDKQRKAAVVAFVPPDTANWRFSLVKMEYSLDDNGKPLRELTPARRYSFLVGENESSHTAQVQLLPILQDDERKPLLSDLEKAFNIEVVTKEFFTRYRDLFTDVTEALKGIIKQNPGVKEDFEAKSIDPVNFAKKLLGQIVFLYFLQKKGWFGVPRDGRWGTGPRDFLRRLFEKKVTGYSNFFNDVLEPLFYNTLAVERTDDYADRFNCKIPFLNGGLFDAMNGYDWVHTDILLPNGLFSNDVKTKEGDTGAGILDVFDRYNFTVREDEPLEKEVAIDPEMLGKVFENLLEVKDRKSKGTYYTPREIVHYMCQESLVNYLDTAFNTGDVPLVTEKPVNLRLFGAPAIQQQSLKTPGYTNKVPREDLEVFIHKGELAVEHDSHVEAQGKETPLYSYRLPESIRLNAKLIDEKLASIRVCDPAIGSGAFPVGIMTEIVRARNVLTTYVGDRDREVNPPTPPLTKGGGVDLPLPLPEAGRGERGYTEGQPRGVAPTDRREDVRTNYEFKRHAIQSCLYGVDIDLGAVEIAKLRLWLSLVVDEEDIKQIQPLPNLDYKIVCGNSLLRFEQNVLYWPLYDELEKLKTDQFDETSRSKKEERKRKIDALFARIKENDRDFNFSVDFSEVFPRKDTENRGFDIVIANPPYVRQENIKELKPVLSKFFDCYDSTADIYVYFYERASKILKKNGTLTYISSNKYFRSGYGEKLRRMLANTCHICRIIDFGDAPVFEAIAYPSIIMLKNAPTQGNEAQVFTWQPGPLLEEFAHVVEEHSFPLAQEKLTSDGWRLERPAVLRLLEKLRKAGKPLGEYVDGRFYRGILTGLNEAFVVDRATRDRLLKEDASSTEVLKPMLRGRDVKRWRIDYQDLYLIRIESSENKLHAWSGKPEKEAEKIFAQTYPVVHRWLEQFRGKLIKRDDQGTYFWELRSCKYWKDFEKTKIVYPDIAQNSEFAFDNGGYYLANTLYLMPTNKLWLLGLLNSNTVFWFYTKTSTQIRGGFVRFIAEYVSQIPVPTPKDSTKIEADVKELLSAKSKDRKADVSELEREIDEMVYRLYGLTGEEIRVVEGVR